MMKNNQNKFMFFENFLNAIEQLPKEEQATACLEFCKYGISGKLPDNKYLAMFCLGVSASVQKYQGRGGAREGAGRPKKQEKQELNENQNIQKNQKNQNIQNTQTETETETINRNKEIYKEKFENFWQEYVPVKCDGRFVDKGSKKTAYDKFVKILDKGENYEDIIRGVRQYINHCKANNQLTCGVTVFLNQERWKNDYGDCQESSRGQRQEPRSYLEIYSEIASEYQQKDNIH